jgi:predicted ATPase
MDVRFVTSMLSIPSEERYGALTMTPQKHKDETLRTLVDLTEAAARRHPSVMLFEDAHWADPTSLEVLDLLIDRVKIDPATVRAHTSAGIPVALVATRGMSPR